MRHQCLPPDTEWLMYTVVRACDGCRRRKIKCDSATTNQWPCAACVRLKLQCIPPAVSYERAGANNSSRLGMQGVLDFDNSSGSGGEDDYTPQPSAPMSFDMQPSPHHMQVPQQPYNVSMGSYNTPPYAAPVNQPDFSFNDVSSGTLSASHSSFQDPNPFDLQPNNGPLSRSNSAWSGEQYSAAELSDILGELKINENGVGT